MITTSYWSSKKTHLVLATFTLVVSGFLLYLHCISPGLEGGMDSYNHYLISKNTWNHPILFLDQWGKPIYNIIASPFVQFGLTGAVVLNIICLVTCSILIYSIARQLKMKLAWMSYLFTLLSPIFLDNVISSLTEPLCAVFVTLCIFFFTVKRYESCAVVAGLLPFVRSEGFIILGVIGLFLLFSKKEYRSILFLFVGPILFNLLGWLIEGKPFWIITENPYINFELSGRNVCGNGSFFHYVRAGHYTFGLVTSALVAGSAVFIAINFFKAKATHASITLFLLFVCFVSYFFAHSFIWWQGMMGSCGYVRVMVVISPIAGLLAAYSLERILSLFNHITSKALVILIISLVMINTLYTPYRYYAYKYPLNISEEQKQYTRLSEWFKSKSLQDRTLIYLYPYFSILMDIDPYNQEEHLDLWASSLQYTKKGDVSIWDSHFGPNESNLPLQQLERDSSWKKIHQIIPKDDIITLNNARFEIHVFEKIK